MAAVCVGPMAHGVLMSEEHRKSVNFSNTELHTLRFAELLLLL
jgi:hypothetical protein